jgi:hypothetical protein
MDGINVASTASSSCSVATQASINSVSSTACGCIMLGQPSPPLYPSQSAHLSKQTLCLLSVMSPDLGCKGLSPDRRAYRLCSPSSSFRLISRPLAHRHFSSRFPYRLVVVGSPHSSPPFTCDHPHHALFRSLCSRLLRLARLHLPRHPDWAATTMAIHRPQRGGRPISRLL